MSNRFWVIFPMRVCTLVQWYHGSSLGDRKVGSNPRDHRFHSATSNSLSCEPVVLELLGVS